MERRSSWSTKLRLLTIAPDVSTTYTTLATRVAFMPAKVALRPIECSPLRSSSSGRRSSGREPVRSETVSTGREIRSSSERGRRTDGGGGSNGVLGPDQGTRSCSNSIGSETGSASEIAGPTSPEPSWVRVVTVSVTVSTSTSNAACSDRLAAVGTKAGAIRFRNSEP